MMHKFFALGLFILVALSACKRDGKGSGNPLDETNASTLAGFWIPIDFCTRAGKAGSILKTINATSKPYAYAFGFNPGNPDSITCYNGMETWKMHVKYQVDTMEIENVRDGKSIFLVYDPKDNKDITMFDGTSGNTRLNRLVLSKSDALNGYSAFLIALNSSMIAGNYYPAGKENEKIYFSSEGTIRGIKDYDRFEFCTGGDCLVMNGIDVVTLSNSKKTDSSQMFGYRFSEKKDTLQLYNLINQNPAEKGNYALGAVAQTYLRKKTVKK